MTKALAKNDERFTLTRGELLALIREAQGIPTGAIGPDVTERPYRDAIYAKDENGESVVVCVSPDKGGPIAINGEHPDDFFKVGDDDHATENVGSLPQTPADELVARAEAAAKRSEAALTAVKAENERAALAAKTPTPAPAPTGGDA